MKYFLAMLFLMSSNMAFSCSKTFDLSSSTKINYLKSGEQTLSVHLRHKKVSCEITNVSYEITDKQSGKVRRLFYRDIPILYLTKGVVLNDPVASVKKFVKSISRMDLSNVKYGEIEDGCFFSYVVSEDVFNTILKEGYPVFYFSSGYESKEWITYIPEYNQTIVVASGGC